MRFLQQYLAEFQVKNYKFSFKTAIFFSYSPFLWDIHVKFDYRIEKNIIDQSKSSYHIKEESNKVNKVNINLPKRTETRSSVLISSAQDETGARFMSRYFLSIFCAKPAVMGIGVGRGARSGNDQVFWVKVKFIK